MQADVSYHFTLHSRFEGLNQSIRIALTAVSVLYPGSNIVTRSAHRGKTRENFGNTTPTRAIYWLAIRGRQEVQRT